MEIGWFHMKTHPEWTRMGPYTCARMSKHICCEKNILEPISVLKRTKKHRKPWKSFKFPFTWAKGWTIAKSIHFVRSNLATLRPVRGVPRKILSIEHSNTSYNLVWKRKNMISEWFEHFSNLHPESLFPSEFTKIYIGKRRISLVNGWGNEVSNPSGLQVGKVSKPFGNHVFLFRNQTMGCIRVSYR